MTIDNFTKLFNIKSGNHKMKLTTTRNLLALGVLSCSLLLPAHSSAQAWPQKPIRFVVPYSAGGATDVGARLVAERLSQSLGQNVLVENRVGATGAIGAGEVARAAPDGYTILVAADLLTTMKLTQKNISWDPVRDFRPITQIAIQPLIIAAHSSVQVDTLDKLIRLARSKPGSLAYSSSGIGSTHHLAGEFFAKQAGITLVHVPYKGSADAFKDLVGGQIPLSVIGAAVLVPYINDKRIKLLAVTTKSRAPAFPNVPTLDESGLRGFDVKTWLGMLAPAGIDPAIAKRLSDETRKILAMPQVRERLAAAGLDVVGNSPEEFELIVKSDVARWTKLVADAKLELN